MKLINIAKATILAAALSLCGCDSFIYDYEGDCDPHYKVRFSFDYNLLFAEAFPQQVNAVTLYVVDDSDGSIVWKKTESGEALKDAAYLMDVDVAPGRYSLLAWCGDGHLTDFSLPDHTHHYGLTCTMHREHDAEGNAFVRKNLDRLYHGRLEPVDFPDEEGTHIYTVKLIKNTNDVNIVLQHLSGEPMSKDDFTFTITDNNGLMNWDNTLLPDEDITYYAHHKQDGTAGFDHGDEEGRTISSMSACVAEHSVARLVKGQDTRVKIYNNEGSKIVDIPLIDFALLVKGHASHPMDDQEYLDRQDKYDIVFFLDEGGRWKYAHIYIGSWKVVEQNTAL